MAQYDFGKQMRAIAKRMNKRVEDVAAETLIDTFTAIIERTPVDTGRLQGEWQTTVQSPAGSQTGQRARAQAVLEIISTVDDPDLYFFSNNMPYAARIEFDGWSHTKAPEGMVRVSLAETAATIRRLAQEVR
jgi:hypothetical protein